MAGTRIAIASAHEPAKDHHEEARSHFHRHGQYGLGHLQRGTIRAVRPRSRAAQTLERNARSAACTGRKCGWASPHAPALECAPAASVASIRATLTHST